MIIKTKLLLLLFIIVSTCSYGQTWTSKANMPEGREGAISFSLNGKVYWGGGTSTSQTVVKDDFYEYDPATDKWTQLANMPEERIYGIGFAINGKGYVALGKKSGSVSSGYLPTLYEYDAAADKWTKKSDFPPGYGVTFSNVFTVNSKAYILGGTNSSFANYGYLYEYDPANDTWTQKSNYPIVHQGNYWVLQPFVFSIGNKGYIVSGGVLASSGSGTEYIKKGFEYDPVTDKWTPISDFPGDGRTKGTAFVLGNKAYCGFGANKDPNFFNVFYNDMYSYDPATDKWTKLQDYPGAERVYPIAVTAGNKAYVGGGSKFQSGYKNDWREFSIPGAVNNVAGKTEQIDIYPNPAKEVITISNLNTTAQYSIYTITGIKVLEGKISPQLKSININTLNPGNYLIDIITGNGSSKGVGRFTVK